MMISPCCGRRYHLDCIQNWASTSRIYHFKCPSCSDKQNFLMEAIAIGIYVPIADAAWETDLLYDFQGNNIS